MSDALLHLPWYTANQTEPLLFQTLLDPEFSVIYDKKISDSAAAGVEMMQMLAGGGDKKSMRMSESLHSEQIVPG